MRDVGNDAVVLPHNVLLTQLLGAHNAHAPDLGVLFNRGGNVIDHLVHVDAEIATESLRWGR